MIKYDESNTLILHIVFAVTLSNLISASIYIYILILKLISRIAFQIGNSKLAVIKSHNNIL